MVFVLFDANNTVSVCAVTVNQWLQFDIGPPTLVTGLITKGRGDTGKKHWVTRYRLSYSNDSQIWYYYKDASHLDPKVSHLFSQSVSNTGIGKGVHVLNSVC